MMLKHRCAVDSGEIKAVVAGGGFIGLEVAENQKEKGIEYIKTRKDAVLQGIYIDDGVSGQKLDRGDFSNLMSAVKNQEIDLIVFTKLDRWFRNLRHYLNTRHCLKNTVSHGRLSISRILTLPLPRPCLRGTIHDVGRTGSAKRRHPYP